MNNSFNCVTLLGNLLSDGFPIQGFSYNADESLIINLYEPICMEIRPVPFGISVKHMDSYTLRVSFERLDPHRNAYEGRDHE